MSGDRSVTDTSWTWVTGFALGDEGDSELELVPDKKTYQPGETAKFAVRGGRLRGWVLITTESLVVS